MAVRRVVPDLAAADVAATRDFYVGLFGFDVAMDMGWIVTVRSASTPAAQISVQRGGGRSSLGLTIEVDDVDSVHEAAVAAGHEIVYPLTHEEWGVRRFFVRDPDGIVVNVMMHTG